MKIMIACPRVVAVFLTSCFIAGTPFATQKLVQDKPEDPDSFRDLIDTFASPERPGYEVFFRPTPPPPDRELRAFPEFEDAGFLVLVNSHQTPIVDLVSAAVETVPIIVIVSDDKDLEICIKVLQEHNFGPLLSTGRIRVIIQEAISPWIRDYGPIYVRAPGGKAIAMDAIYNEVRPGIEKKPGEMIPFLLGGEFNVPTYRPPIILAGGNFTSDGQGLCFTSTATIRENGGNRDTTNRVLVRYFGCDEVVYLEPLPGSETTEHIDMFFRVADAKTYLLGSFEGRPHPHTAPEYLQAEAQQRMERNLKTLQDVVSRRHLDTTILRVPMPDISASPSEATSAQKLDELQMRASIENDADALSGVRMLKQLLSENPGFANERLRQLGILNRTYLNYIHLKHGASEVVLVPNYKSDILNKINQRKVDEVLHRAYPQAKMRYLDSDKLIEGAGALHCISLVVPAQAVPPSLAQIHDPGIDGNTVQNNGSSLGVWPNSDVAIPTREAIDEYRSLLAYQEYKQSREDWSDLMKRLLWRRAVRNVLERSALERGLSRIPAEVERSEIIEKARAGAGNDWGQEGLRDYFTREATRELEFELFVRESGIGAPELITEQDILDYFDEHESEYRTPGQIRAVWASFASSEPAAASDVPGAEEGAAQGARPTDAPDESGDVVRRKLLALDCNDDAAKISSEAGVVRILDSGVISEGDDETFSSAPEPIRFWIWVTLEPGEVSPVINDGERNLMVRLCQRTEPERIDSEQAAASIQDAIEEQRRQELQDRVMNGLLSGFLSFDVELPQIADR